MNISLKLIDKIQKKFAKNEKLKNQLLAFDERAIQEIGIMGQKGISPEDVVEAYENDCIEYLYYKAKNRVEIKEIYDELCDLYFKDKQEKRKRNLPDNDFNGR